MVDLIQMIGNLSQSLFSVQQLISGFGYMIGILLVFHALSKLKKISDYRVMSPSHEQMFVPIAYLIGGAALIFLPTMFDALSTSLFGSSNVLAYSPYVPYNIESSMNVVIQTAGLIWFIRGFTLTSHASEPGCKDGSKGIAFLVGGLLAMNFTNTMEAVNYILDQIMSFTFTTKNST